MTVIVDGVKSVAASPTGAIIEVSEIEALAKGTLIVGDGTGAPAGCPVGTDAQLLVADSVQPRGVAWTANPVLTGLTVNGRLSAKGNAGGVVGGFASGGLHVKSPSALVNANAVITGHNSFGGDKQLWYLGSTSSSSDAIALINRQNAALSLSTNNTIRLSIEAGGDVGIGITTATGQLHVDQSSISASQPVLVLDQADVSEDMIQFDTTIGVGNAIEAVGPKTLTTTHFIKVTIPGGLTRYIPVGTIA